MEQTALDERVPSRIRSELRRRRMSQAALARELGRTENFISRRLRGEVSFSVDDLDQVARALDVPLENLVAPPGQMRI